ncbi:MAG TPA: ABC transporter permease [bacterium]|nr:ABC transporter permease [bacterium]
MSDRRDALTVGLWVFLGMVGVYMLAPLALVIVDSVNPSTYGTFPFAGVTLHWYVNALFQVPEFRSGLSNSLVVAFGAVVLSVILGTLAAYGLTRYRFYTRELTQSFLLLPLIVPAIVFGAALFLLYIRIGLYGTLSGLILGHALLGLPFVVSIVAASLQTLGRDYEEAAMDLGANPVLTFFKVTIPSIRPGLIVSALFAFVTSFDQVEVSLFLTRPRNNTLPIAMFNYEQNYQDPTLAAISAVLIGFTVVLVLIAVSLLKTQDYRKLIQRR